MDKREALLDSALELFSNRGYENTPTSLISKNAGVATGTLFHHFPSKEVLINQLYLDCKLRMMKHIIDGMEGCETAAEKIRAVWDSMIGWALNNEERFLFIMQNKQNSYIKEETHRQIASQYDDIFELTGEMFEHDKLRDIPAELMRELSAAMLEGTISYFRKNPDKFMDEREREGAFRIFAESFLR